MRYENFTERALAWAKEYPDEIISYKDESNSSYKANRVGKSPSGVFKC